MSKKLPNILNALGRFKSVKNCTSSNFKEVPNQFILEFENGTVYQSYDSIIAISFNSKVTSSKFLNSKTILSEYWKRSKTTSKFLFSDFFINSSIKEVKASIDSEDIILVPSITLKQEV